MCCWAVKVAAGSAAVSVLELLLMEKGLLEMVFINIVH